ncbi:hypothetical protein EG327_009653 [Venturia inaequalis]|uniref:Uncharacterized protein n=1 Tax=Venturia inaequalis TaxID=5025 RepID=A0A8H3UNR3_VENIN|nr:hypothetical protein EG327_009653 [Venturia inaequalis]
MAPRTHILLTALYGISSALLNQPQITAAPSIAHQEVKRATDGGNGTLVGYYTESEGGAWQTNTCGESATWSTSGQYGACAGKPSQSLYTSCSGNVLVGAEGSTTQSCGATCAVASSTTSSSIPAPTAGDTSSPTAATSGATPAATAALHMMKKFASGGIAGVILAILAVMGVVLLAALWFLKKRKNKMKQQGLGEMADTSRQPPVELPAEERLRELPSNESVAAELHGNTGYESRGGR